jgi:hypothetical protein
VRGRDNNPDNQRASDTGGRCRRRRDRHGDTETCSDRETTDANTHTEACPHREATDSHPYTQTHTDREAANNHADPEVDADRRPGGGAETIDRERDTSPHA